MAYKIVNDDSLTSVANAIRVQGSISGTLEFPDGFVSAIQNLSPSPTLQTKSVAFTPAETIQTSSVTADSGYDGLDEVDITVNAMPSMSLPNSASATSIGTVKGIISPSKTERYLNIPSGYNSSAKYYTIHQMVIDSKTITSNGTYYAEDEDAHGWDEVIVNVSGITPSGTMSITSNGTYDVTQYASADVNVSGGGASNVVVGSFKATEDGVLTIPLAYTGTGYPLSLIVFVKDGYNASGTDFASLVSQNAVAVWGFTKSYPNLTPTYLDDSVIENKCDPFIVRKNSTSSATSYSPNSTSSGISVFSARTPYSNWNQLLKIASATSMRVCIASSGYAFRPNIEYEYHIVYSS